jgi:hypothetical protein
MSSKAERPRPTRSSARFGRIGRPAAKCGASPDPCPRAGQNMSGETADVLGIARHGCRLDVEVGLPAAGHREGARWRRWSTRCAG